MIVRQYVKDFENLGFGLFVHFGAYSLFERGEWVQEILKIPSEEYEKVVRTFNPDKDWAEQLVAAAKTAGCKYITLTTRHHDGFSLYDTCGLNDYDAPHTCGRDLVREFVDACNAGGIIPFFYHTLFEWRTDWFEKDPVSYLPYLRDSVEILCKNYGKIGGLWFDGMWRNDKLDWEEDKLYGLIRSYQPEAMIINNTGLWKLGELGHIELDSVTFERGKPTPINQEGAKKYIASEMCQVLNDHWGYAAGDYNYKSFATLISDLTMCRRYRSNFLLNVGPMPSGKIRPIEAGILEGIGTWVRKNEEAIYEPAPSGIAVDNEDDFILRKDNNYYLFIHGVPMMGDPDVSIETKTNKLRVSFSLSGDIKKATWLDDGSSAELTKDGDKVTVKMSAFSYGNSGYVRVCKIEL